MVHLLYCVQVFVERLLIIISTFQKKRFPTITERWDMKLHVMFDFTIDHCKNSLYWNVWCLSWSVGFWYTDVFFIFSRIVLHKPATFFLRLMEHVAYQGPSVEKFVSLYLLCYIYFSLTAICLHLAVNVLCIFLKYCLSFVIDFEARALIVLSESIWKAI